MIEQNKTLTKVLEWLVEIDAPAIIASVNAKREKYPSASKKQLAEKIFSSARWKVSSNGFLSGLPSNPWTEVPAVSAEAVITLRIEVVAVARAAVIYDENFFDDEDAKWELLIPVFGFNVVSQFAIELGIRGSIGANRAAIKKYHSKETQEQFKKIILKYLSIKMTQKGVISKSLPVIGRIIVGGRDYIEVGQVLKRTITYFEGKYT